MSADPSDRPRATFTITHERKPSTTLVAGFASFGLAGLTAANFLVDQLDLEETGHVEAEALPTFTPFEAGTPRHHSRLFSRDDLDLTVLVNELFVPVDAADSFASEVIAWTEANEVEEVTILSGVPYRHGPEEHRVYYVATEDYQSTRLVDVDLPPMGNGFLDGVNASIVARGMESPLRTGLFVTPVHAQVPDVEASIRLIDALELVYGLTIDSGPLVKFAEEVERYYRDLADRLEAVQEEQVPDDRMYM
ncbi:MAG: proteasome assembly chaperone family protein [Salinigranum sp.]